MEKVIIISAHPDDEILGAGGTLLKHAKQNDAIEWIIVTGMHEQDFSKEVREKRKKEIEAVAKGCKISKVHTFDYPASSLNASHMKDLVGKISKIFKDFEPSTIYVMNRSDAHSDHRVVFQAVMACTKSFRYPYIKKVLMYECISETEFSPALPENTFIANYFVDISEFFDKKIELMKIYESELSNHPFPRSIENIKALATFRGATVGVHYAEAFYLLLAKA